MNVEVLGDDVAYGAFINLERLKSMGGKALKSFTSKSGAERAALLKRTDTRFSAGKQLRKILPRKVTKFRFGDDIDRVYGGCVGYVNTDMEMMGGLDDIFKSVVGAVKTFIKSDTGKVVATAVVGTAIAAMTPTQKAQLAQAQTAAGMTPQAISAVSGSPVAIPTGKPSFFTANAPWLIIGGVAVVGGIMMFATMKKR